MCIGFNQPLTFTNSNGYYDARNGGVVDGFLILCLKCPLCCWCVNTRSSKGMWCDPPLRLWESFLSKEHFIEHQYQYMRVDILSVDDLHKTLAPNVHCQQNCKKALSKFFTTITWHIVWRHVVCDVIEWCSPINRLTCEKKFPLELSKMYTFPT